jgi:hypothetical protein
MPRSLVGFIHDYIFGEKILLSSEKITQLSFESKHSSSKIRNDVGLAKISLLR